MPTYCIDLTAYNTLARPRGIGRYIYFLAEALHGIRDELERDERLVGLVRVRGENAFSEDLILDHHLEELPPRAEQPRHFQRYFKKRRRFLRRTLRGLQPDVVHFAEGPAALPLSFSRTVVTCHDLIPLLMPAQYLGRGPFVGPVQRAKDYLRYRRADRVISISHATREALIREVEMPSERIAVIHHGIDRSSFGIEARPGEREDLRRRFGLPDRYTLYVGAADARKRVELLLEAQVKVYERTGVPLAIVGSWFSDASPALRARLDAMPAGSTLRLGAVEDADLPPLYRSARAFLLPSIYEGFGLPILEAMMSGCPVVTTSGGALGEVAGSAVRYVPADDGDALRAAMVELISDDANCNELRAAGLRRVEAFSWPQCARATLEVYRWAVGRSPGPGTSGEVS